MAAQIYWDTNGSISGAGANADGTWDDTTQNWTTSSAGTISTIAYPGNRDVVFAAGNDLIRANVFVSTSQEISGLTFEDGAVTLSGAQLISDSDLIHISVADGASATLNNIGVFSANFDVQGSGTLHVSAITGGSDMIKSGSGTATFYRLDARLTVAEGAAIFTGANAAKLKNAVVNSGASLILQGEAFDGFKRNLTVDAGGVVEFAAGLTQTISQLDGSGSIVGGDGAVIKVGGDNKSATFDGRIAGGMDVYSIGSGSFTLSDNSTFEIVVKGNGVSNSLQGDGVNSTTTQLNGEFIFDLSEADLSVGNSWLIVDVGALDETYGDTFKISNFRESVEGVWVSDANGLLQFSESTGYLAVIPEPSAGTMLFIGLSFLIACVKRRK
jgi:hypothetical protein